MEKYKDVISKVLSNRPLLGDENRNPNTDRQIDDLVKIRKVNFKLQDDKAQLIQELKMLRDSYLRQKKTSESQAKENKHLKAELSKFKEKLQKTETVKNKMEKRLYSARPITSLSSKQISTKCNSTFNTQRAPITNRPLHYQISLQTNQIHTYDIGCQTEPDTQNPKKQETKPKRQILNTLHLSTKTATDSDKISCYETDKTSFRTSVDGPITERATGRIVKGRRKH